MSVIWSGITEEGAVVPVQVTTEGKVVATATPAGTYVETSGDTMTGDLILPGTPENALGAVPKEYVDARTSANVFAYGYIGSSLDPSPYCYNVDNIRRVGEGRFRVYYVTPSPTSFTTVVLGSVNNTVTTSWQSSDFLSFDVIQYLTGSSTLYDSASFSFSVFANPTPQTVAYTE